MKNEDREIARVCEYCEYASPIQITGNMLCEKKGIVSCDYACLHFSYDPLKRVPAVIRTPSLEYVPLEDEEEQDEKSEDEPESQPVVTDLPEENEEKKEEE